MNLIKTKTRNINNQRVYEEIDKFMIDVFTELSIHWQNPNHRDQLVEMVDMWFEQFALDSGKIIQFDVQCAFPSDDRINFKLKYRQKNCFNTSTIEYIFEV